MAENADGAADRGVTALTADTRVSPDLKHGRLSLPEVLAQSVANMAPSAAMALLPLLVFAGAGNGTWVAFLIDLLAAASVAFFDIGLSAKTALILESISVTIILILSVNIWVHNGTVFDTHQLSLTGVKPGGILVGVVLAIFAFVGFESAGSLGVESKN